MASGRDKLVAPGRHTRRPGRAGLRRVCVATLIMLVLQYGLGIFLNLYVAVPASDAHAGIFGEIATAPLALTVHALLGLALIGAAILLVVRAVAVRDRLLAVLATAGLTAIGGAFGAGEIFVKNGQSTALMAMAVLTGVALLCYVGTLALCIPLGLPLGLPLAAAAQRGAGRGAQREVELPVLRQASHPVPAPGFPAQQNWHVASPGVSTGSWFARE